VIADMTLKCLKYCTILLVLLVFGAGLSTTLDAQDTSKQSEDSEETTGKSGSAEETAGGIEDQETQEAAENLIEATLGNDINTASYYELVPWCRDLGLDDSGTRQALQQRLYAYYAISPPAEEAEPEGKGRLLEIKSAKETQYFTIEQVDEDYVLLLGDVLVEIKEEEATHRIRAHRILLNETENILSADGGIEYTLIKGREEEVFRGQRLTFNIDSWEGVFFSGGIEVDRTVGGETVRFRFTGESISRLEDNTVVIDRGEITSCDLEEDPHYHIRARKIWVLAPNEWAILNAVLYIGRVPVLYLPFFFRPGDEFFFHPAVGYRDAEGQFIQTTTYLIGQKRRSSSALSFLAATEESTTQYEMEREGLFLRPVADKPTVIEDDRFLKVMLDLYSRLGVFAGVEGSFPKATFKGGVAQTTSFWDTAPEEFRFGFESSWNIGNDPNRLSGSFEYFSDPAFPTSYYNRSEDTGLTRIMGIEPIGETATAAEKQVLTWELTGKMDFSDKFDTPLVKTLSFPYITANLLWENVNDGYNPTNLKLPSASFQMLGTLLSITRPSARSGTKAVQKTSPMPAELRPPWDDSPAVQPESGASQPLPSLRPPEPKTSVPVSLQKTPVQFDLAYQIRPTTDLKQIFDTTTPWSPWYSELSSQGTFSLDNNLRILENVLLWSGILSIKGYYLHYTRQNHPDDSQWAGLETGAQNNSQFSVAFNQGLDFFPLADDPIFGNTSLSYDVGSTFYRYYDKDTLTTGVDYSGQFIEWSDEWFSIHSAQSAFRWRMFGKQNSLSVSAQLPPRPGSFTGSLEYRIWLLTTTVNSVFQDSDAAAGWENINDWSWQPVVFRETLRLSDDINFSEELRFDVNRATGSGLLAKSVSTVNLWNLSGSLNMDYSKLQVFDFGTESWQDATGEAKLRPSYITLSYNSVGEERLFWKNRIRIGTSVNTSWYMNILQFTDNSLDFSLTFDFWLYRVLKLSLTTSSYNNQTYLYFPKLAEKLGQEPKELLPDLFSSFNFFDRGNGEPSAREQSAFNLRSIKVEAVHYLHDWNLSLSYEGKPYLVETVVANEYQWKSTFSVILQWQPIPELRSNIKRSWNDEDDVYESSLRG